MSGTCIADAIVVDSDSDSDCDSRDLVVVGAPGKRKRGFGADQQSKRAREVGADRKSKRAREVLATLLSFTDMPTEILQCIFTLCAVEDIVSLYSSCSTFRAAIQDCLFLRKVNAMATLCTLSQSCMFFDLKEMYIPGLEMLYRSYKGFNHVTNYLGLPVYSVRCLQKQDVAWSSQWILTSLPERSDNLGFIEASVSFTLCKRYVIRKGKGKCEIPADKVPEWKKELKSKIYFVIENLEMEPYGSPINLGRATKCYMIAPTASA